VESRALVPSELGGYLDGHGAITRDPRALDLVMTTIATRAIPADTRSDVQKEIAAVESVGALGVALTLCAFGAVIACALAFALRGGGAPIRLVTRGLAEARLRDVRRK
jgi:hypothetical protein